MTKLYKVTTVILICIGTLILLHACTTTAGSTTGPITAGVTAIGVGLEAAIGSLFASGVISLDQYLNLDQGLSSLITGIANITESVNHVKEAASKPDYAEMSVAAAGGAAVVRAMRGPAALPEERRKRKGAA